MRSSSDLRTTHDTFFPFRFFNMFFYIDVRDISFRYIPTVVNAIFPYKVTRDWGDEEYGCDFSCCP